jgi:hypothetical protein
MGLFAMEHGKAAYQADRLAVETLVPEADDAFASRTIAAAGGTTETLVSNGLRGRQFVVTLARAT